MEQMASYNRFEGRVWTVPVDLEARSGWDHQDNENDAWSFLYLVAGSGQDKQGTSHTFRRQGMGGSSPENWSDGWLPHI